MRKHWCLFFLLFLFFSFVFSFSEECCSHYLCKYFNPNCYGKCKIRKDPGGYLRTVLKEKFSGQDHVQEDIVQMLNHYQVGKNKKPLSFHIAGDNGVGKSFMVKLIAESLYQNGYQHSLLVISGTNYEGTDPLQVKIYKKSLFQLISKHLKKCPTGMVVLDEVQYIHSSTLMVLRQFLDETGFVILDNGEKVFTNDAIFGFISDFGIEGKTKDMNAELLEELVLEQTRVLWDVDPKQSQQVQYTFPFHSLSDREMENIIQMLVTKEIPSYQLRSKVQDIAISDAASKLIRSKATKMYPNENGRGIEKYVINFILPALRKHAEEANSPPILKIAYFGEKLEYLVVEPDHFSNKRELQ